VTLSEARCLWPSVRLGTTSVRATAAFGVTVRIMLAPLLTLLEKPLDCIPHSVRPHIYAKKYI
jgi:hypothetical protein